MVSTEKRNKILLMLVQGRTYKEICSTVHVSRRDVVAINKELIASPDLFSLSGNVESVPAPKPVPTEKKGTDGKFKPQEVMKDLAKTDNPRQFDALRYMIEHPGLFTDRPDIPDYETPELFSPKQIEIIDDIIDKNIKLIFIQGVQRSGKSTAVFAGLHEYAIKYHPKMLKFDLMAGKGKQARRILTDLYRDPILKDANRSLLVNKISDKITWWNGTQLEAHETTVADIKGGDVDVGWIDEFDVAIKHDEEAVVTLLFAMRAIPNLKIIISANMDSGAYQLIKQIIEKKAYADEKVAFVDIYTEDASWLKQAGNDDLLTEIGTAIAGEEFVKRRLENIYLGTGDVFDAQSLIDSLETYNMFMMQQGHSSRYTVLSIDPSGAGHPFGWFIGSVDIKGMNFWEIESGELQLGSNMDEVNSGIKWTWDRIIYYLIDKAKKYNVTGTVESNSGGQAIKLKFLSVGIKMVEQNFGAKDDKNSRSQMIHLARRLLDERCCYIKGEKLKNELMIYDPAEKEKDKYKGDVADAFVHCMYRLAKLSQSPYYFEVFGLGVTTGKQAY